MRKLVAAINMTLDGYCDHTAINPDAEIHDHYTALINSGEAILYGRITYNLMEYWREVLKNPGGERSMDDFAKVIDRIPKIVFSHTLKNLDWDSARLATGGIADEVNALKQGEGKDILVGSRSIMMSCLQLNLLDELQICVHPVIAGAGLPLFENIHERFELKLLKTKTFGSGAVIFYYSPSGK